VARTPLHCHIQDKLNAVAAAKILTALYRMELGDFFVRLIGLTHQVSRLIQYLFNDITVRVVKKLAPFYLSVFPRGDGIYGNCNK
jgi:hypothetical protein